MRSPSEVTTRFILTSGAVANYGGESHGVRFIAPKGDLPGHQLFTLRAVLDNGDEFDFSLNSFSCNGSESLWTSHYPIYKDHYVTFLVAPYVEEEEDEDE